ncbi:MAG: HAD-IA family hydrolase [Armatimonadetes bacterium]|nr:HAD-IA family hydrolase [Armatimonadota bacterium]
MSHRVVAFDLGGVLIRICNRWSDAVELALPEQGLNEGLGLLNESTALVAYQAGKFDTSEYLVELARFLGCRTADQAKLVHNAILVEPYPGTAELTQDIASAGLQTGCLSNTNDLHWQEIFGSGRFPFADLLTVNVASHHVGVNKPDPAMFEAFERKSGFSGSEIVYFDDTKENVEAARVRGWHAHAVDPSVGTTSQVRRTLGLAIIPGIEP